MAVLARLAVVAILALTTGALAQPAPIALEQADEAGPVTIRLPQGELTVERRRFHPVPADPRVLLDGVPVFEPDPEYFDVQAAWRLGSRSAVLFSQGCQTCGVIQWYFAVFGDGAPRLVEGFASRYVDNFRPARAAGATGIAFPPRVEHGRWVRERFDFVRLSRAVATLGATEARAQNCRALWTIFASCTEVAIHTDLSPPTGLLRAHVRGALMQAGNIAMRSWHVEALDILQGRERPFWEACVVSNARRARAPADYADFAQQVCAP